MTIACRGDCVSAAAAASHAARRREPEKSPRRRSPAYRRPRAVCRRSPGRLGCIALVRGRAGGPRGLHPRRGRALLGLLLCLALLGALSLAVPTDREDEFYRHQYVSKFARSSAIAAIDLATGSVLEADGATADRLPLATGTACEPSGKLPHIVMVFDESSFDATMLPGVKVAPEYRERFRSSDGKIRAFIV